MRRQGLSAGEIQYAGGNPCFSETTGQQIPGCVQPFPFMVTSPTDKSMACDPGINPTCGQSPIPSLVPSWVWWAAGIGFLVLISSSD